MKITEPALTGRRSVVLFASALLLSFPLCAQQTIDIGTGTLTNDFFTYPAPYGNAQNGARHQMLVLASELQAAGMSAGDISSVAFDVSSAAFVDLNGFTVSIGTTDVSDMTPAWVQGLTPVWGPLTYADQDGWNTHTFDTPFSWDGVSNIVVQTCFSNNVQNFNAQFFQSATAFNSTISRSTPNSNVCTSNGGTLNLFQQRPNMRFEWSSLAAPPIAAFLQSATFTCDGNVQFTDQTQHLPTTWHWDFGDSDTDTVASPLHVYLADGVYTPVLIVTNPYGSDTVSGDPITVSANGPRPIAACLPVSTGTVQGLGIISVTIEGHVTTSPDAATEGYADRSCQLDTVSAGTLLDITVETATAAPQFVRVWVDWDNSGDFISSELVLSADNVLIASASVLVPVFAVQNTPLRLRAMVDYPFPPAGPCADPQYGQAEDYAVVVIPNPDPPQAIFSASPTFSCNGVVQFTDASLNTPSSWTWDFGDQGPVSNETSPQHTYAASGTYTVSLTVTNTNGSNTQTLTDLIVVDLSAQLVASACTPATQGYCCGYGIASVNFAGINSTSVDGIEGYVDRSCGNTAQVTEGNSYPISIGTGGTNDHDVVVWMDLDNNGTFDVNEQVWSVSGQQNPNGNLIVPSATVFGTPVRMRITGDVVGEISGPCDPPLYGQTEDYSVIITPNPNPPVAVFTASPTTTCTGFVQFTDGSLAAPTSWSWDFGDTGSSSDPSPLHQYTAPGTYTVSLTVTNANGSDTQISNNLIHFVEPALCDTIPMPFTFQDVTDTTCQGVLVDDGGSNGNYFPGTSGAFTIAPQSADIVVLTFSQFQWGNNPNRYLAIYDGPDVFSTLIGDFNGNGLNQLPNNGVITSSGPSITLQQDGQGGGPPPNSAGFILTWDCSFTGIAEQAMDPIGNVWPQPAEGHFTIGFGREADEGWKLTVRDAVGSTVAIDAVSKGEREHIFDAEGWASGFYVLSVETPRGRWNRTIAIR